MFDASIVFLFVSWSLSCQVILSRYRRAPPEDTELVFLFADPDLPMPQAKRRKDGTKRSHADWATSKKFRWYTSETIPDEWKYYVNPKETE